MNVWLGFEYLLQEGVVAQQFIVCTNQVVLPNKSLEQDPQLSNDLLLRIDCVFTVLNTDTPVRLIYKVLDLSGEWDNSSNAAPSPYKMVSVTKVSH